MMYKSCPVMYTVILVFGKYSFIFNSFLCQEMDHAAVSTCNIIWYKERVFFSNRTSLTVKLVAMVIDSI